MGKRILRNKLNTPNGAKNESFLSVNNRTIRKVFNGRGYYVQKRRCEVT